jgi:hypothetical protein
MWPPRAPSGCGAFPTPPVPFRLVTEPRTANSTTDPTDPGSSVRAVPYKGADLDAELGPGLGCFRFQLLVLATLIVLTPIGVAANWPFWLTAALLFATIGLLLVVGQTIIFLLRLVAADRRGRRRPLASATRTVGELEDEPAADASPAANASAASAEPAAGEPAAGEPAADASSAPAEPAPRKPASGEPTAGEPVVGEPVADEPSVRQ